MFKLPLGLIIKAKAFMASQGWESCVEANYDKNIITKRNFIPQTQIDHRKLQAYQKGGSVFVCISQAILLAQILKNVIYASEKGTAQF